MINREMLIHPHIASLFVQLAFEYSLPLNIHSGETVVLPQKGNSQRSVLKKITVECEESNEDYLDAALVILNLA